MDDPLNTYATSRHARSRRSPKRPKSVTFTGCWTCRSRKVKCDERQKDGCRACEHAGLKCAGYAVSLCWVTDSKQRSPVQRTQRRMIQPDRRPVSSLSEDCLSRILHNLDTISDPRNTITIGPFSVFSSQLCPASPLSVAGSLIDSPQQSNFSLGQEGLIGNVGLISSGDEDCLSVNPISHDGDASLHMELSLSRERVMTGSSTDIEEEQEEDEEEKINHSASAQQSAGSQQQQRFSSHRGLSLPVYQDHHTSMLLYHYMNHVADLLQPVIHSQNPWKTTYLPFALQGCPDLFLAQKQTPSSHASISLFHSLLSSAAFHLNNTTNNPTVFKTLGIRHRVKALQALNSAPIQITDPQLYAVYLTAMLALVTIDTMVEEDASDFPVHLRGCRQLRRLPYFTTLLDDTDSQVRSICNVLTLLARTVSHDIRPRPWRSKEALYSTPWRFLKDDRSIEYIYGVTPVLGNILLKTCDIIEHLAFYKGQQIPVDLVDECEAVQAELSMWHIDSESFRLIQPTEQTKLEIVRCQARAFHGAIYIFYYCTIEGYQNSANIQNKVRSIWVNLTQAENLKDEYMGGQKRTAPMSWPAFIASCQAANRQPWIDWWTRVQEYGMGNFKRQWLIIQQIWSIMDADRNVTDWRDALKQTGKIILPI